MLTRLLAIRDSYYIPARVLTGNNQNANVWSARRLYEAGGGIPWTSNAKSEREQKEMQRAKDEAEASGLIIAVRVEGRTSGIKLTDAGEHQAASYAMMYTMADSVCLYEAIKRRQAAGIYDFWEDDLIPNLPEWADAKLHDRRTNLALVMDLLLPWMVRWYVHGASSTLR